MDKSTKLLMQIDENFYSTFDTAEKFMSFLIKLCHAICEDYHLPPVKIQFKHRGPRINGYFMPKSDFSSIKTITINQNYIYDGFKTYKNSNNLCFVFSILNTIYHETRHYMQSCTKKIADMHPIVKLSYNLSPLNNEKDYCVMPWEIDARHFAYTQIAKHPILKKYLQSNIYKSLEKTLLTQKFDFEPLIKFSNRPLKFVTKKRLKQALAQHEELSSVYHAIAPSFQLLDQTDLSEEDSLKINQEAAQFTFREDLYDKLKNYYKEFLSRITEFVKKISDKSTRPPLKTIPKEALDLFEEYLSFRKDMDNEIALLKQQLQNLHYEEFRDIEEMDKMEDIEEKEKLLYLCQTIRENLLDEQMLTTICIISKLSELAKDSPEHE